MYYIFWVCVCSLSYAACKAHASYYSLLWLTGAAIFFFSHYLMNGTIIGKRLLNTKSEFWFCLLVLSEILLILSRNVRDIIINVHWSWCNVHVILVTVWWNFNFLERCPKNTQISNFVKNSSSGSRVVPRERTDSHDKATGRFSWFCERAKMWCYYTDSNNILLFRKNTFRTLSDSATWKWQRSYHYCDIWTTEILVSTGLLLISQV
jgi:hypothetical protein